MDLLLTASSFTETNSITGQLIPKKYVGGYGTNGFYLNFSDNSGTTATTLARTILVTATTSHQIIFL